MKKSILFLLIVSLLVFFTACSVDTKVQSGRDRKSKPDAVSESEVSKEDKLAEDDARFMLPVIASEVEYLDINANTLDLSNLNPEDFWNIIAIAVDADPGVSGPDAYGICHMSLEELMPYIETLVNKSYSVTGIPPISESYCVSIDPLSDKYDVLPLSLSNKTYTMESFKHSEESWFGEDYILRLSLSQTVSGQDIAVTGANISLTSEAAAELAPAVEKNYWQVYLKYWNDGTIHRFPMQVVNIIKMEE